MIFEFTILINSIISRDLLIIKKIIIKIKSKNGK